MTMANNSNTISHIFPNLQKKSTIRYKNPKYFLDLSSRKRSHDKKNNKNKGKSWRHWKEGVERRDFCIETFEQTRFISSWTGDA